MKIEAFRYTKQKDGETKNYVVAVLEKNSEYLEGIDIGKLSGEEMTKVVHLVANHEKRMFELEKLALEEKKEFADMIEEPIYKSESEEYRSKMKPYIEKAYRKFLISNIHEYAGIPGNQE